MRMLLCGFCCQRIVSILSRENYKAGQDKTLYFRKTIFICLIIVSSVCVGSSFLTVDIKPLYWCSLVCCIVVFEHMSRWISLHIWLKVSLLLFLTYICIVKVTKLYWYIHRDVWYDGISYQLRNSKKQTANEPNPPSICITIVFTNTPCNISWVPNLNTTLRKNVLYNSSRLVLFSVFKSPLHNKHQCRHEVISK